MSDLPQDDTLPTTNAPQCCGLGKLLPPTLVLITIASVCAAAYFAGRSSAVQATLSQRNLPLIEATAAVTSDKYSIATGAVSEDADGLFVLDHNSGLLQCNVIYPRLGQYMGLFTVNVADTLGTGAKGGKYMMLTGRAEFPRASNRPAASTVVYVMDTTSGNYACYGIPFDNSAKNANRQQKGAMVLINTGTANPVIDRDNLR